MEVPPNWPAPEVLGWNPGKSDVCYRGCAYTLLQTVQRPAVCSAVYGRKKNIPHIFEKVSEGHQIKKYWTNVNEGDEKNQQKKHSWKKVFYFLKLTWFFSECFLSTKIKWVFFENRQQFNARAGQKKHMFFL